MMDTFNNYNELAIANDSAPYIPLHLRDVVETDNMSPSIASYAEELGEGMYRFVEMPSDGISYRVAAIDVNDPKNMPAYIFDKFINKKDAMQKLNAARNVPGCKWTGPDASRIIQVEDYKKGAVYEDLGD